MHLKRRRRNGVQFIQGEMSLRTLKGFIVDAYKYNMAAIIR